MSNTITINLDDADPTFAIHAFLTIMNRQRTLRLMPRTEHTLIEHLMREEARILYYSSACGIVSIVESKDEPMDEDGLDETMQVIQLLANRRKRKRARERKLDLRREMVAGDIEQELIP